MGLDSNQKKSNLRVRRWLSYLAYSGMILSGSVIPITDGATASLKNNPILMGHRDAIAQQPTSSNIDKAKADRLFKEGQQLLKAGIESKKEAIKKFEEAEKIYHDLGDRSNEALTLKNLGTAYYDLKENQKSLEYYNKSLLLYQTIGDRDGIARNLNNIGNVYKDLGEKQKALDYYNRSLSLSRAVGDRDGML